MKTINILTHRFLAGWTAALVLLLAASFPVSAQILYNANGESGFGGPVGGSTMEISDDGTTITVTLTRGGGDFNDAMVIYFSTGEDGRSAIGTEINDRGDGLRAAISWMDGISGADLVFPEGFEATHALGIDTNWGAIWEIPAEGSVGDHQLPYGVGVNYPDGDASFTDITFEFDWSDIGLEGGDSFDFVATYLNPWGGDGGLGFASNEGYGSGFPSSNVGQAGLELTGFLTYPLPFIETDQAGDWDDTDTWVGGAVPDEGDDVIIGHNVTLNQNATVASLTINSDQTLTFEAAASRVLTIEAGGSLNNEGTLDADNGKVAFAGTGTVTGTVDFNDVDISGGVDFGNDSSVEGTLRILSGGFFRNDNGPAYAVGSTLVYETGGDYGAGVTWPTGEADAPYHVTIVNSEVNFGASDELRFILGDLWIQENGELALSTAFGGDLEIKGDWTNEGDFNANRRAVIFSGEAQQVLTNDQPAGIQIDFLINNNDESLSVASDLISSIYFENNGELDMNGNTLVIVEDPEEAVTPTIQNDGTFNNENAVVRFEADGQVTGAENITFAHLELEGGVSLASGTVIGGRLTLKAGGFLAQTAGGDGIAENNDLPDYQPGAVLAIEGPFGIDHYASGWGTEGNKIPDNIEVGANDDVSIDDFWGVLPVKGTLTLVDNNFDANNKLIFLSTDEGTARIAAEGEGTMSGTFSVQRWLDNEIDEQERIEENIGGIWKLIGSPLDTEIVANEGLFSNVWTQGFEGSNDNDPGIDPNVFTYDESVDIGEGQSNLGWQPVDNATDAADAGKGFLIYMYTYDDPHEEEGDWPKTLVVSGEFNAFENNEGTASLPVTFEENGFNLVANPFLSTIDFDNENHQFTNVDEAYYTYADDGTPRSYVKGTGSPGNALTNEIPAFQGFFVVANGANPELVLSSEGKVEGSVNDLRKPAEEDNLIRLLLTDAEENTSDELLIRLSEEGSNNKISLDAYQLQSLAKNYHQIGGLKSNYDKALSILNLPLPDDQLVIDLDMRSNVTVDLLLSLNSPALQDFHLSLLNRSTSVTTPITEDVIPVVLDELDGEPELLKSPSLNTITRGGESGYALIISTTPVVGGEWIADLPVKAELAQNYPNPFNPVTLLSYSLPEDMHVQLSVYDITGRQISVLVNEERAAGHHEVTFDASSLSSGVYVYRLEAGSQTFTRKMTVIK